jgi:hypothetical protein
LTLTLFAWVAITLPALGQDALIYQGPVPVKLKGETISLPVSLFASSRPEQSDQLQLHAHTNVNELRPVLRRQLSRLADEKANTCELRLSVLDASSRLGENQIFVSATLQAEIWLCTTILQTVIGKDTFTIEIGAIPEVRSGRLHLDPGSLTVSDMDETLRAIGGELLLQQIYVEAINRFNNNPKLTGLPPKLAAAGYSYRNVVTGSDVIGPSTLRVSIVGPNDLIALAKTIADMR